jgi:hypothetical protein
MDTSAVQRLSEKEKERFKQYMSLFVEYCPRKGFFQKNSYCSDFVQAKRKDKITPLGLYGEFGIATVERHLDHGLWWHWQNAKKSDYLPHNPIWMALNSPRKIRHDAIDVDAKDHIIGYYSATTKINDRMPVVFLPLAHFQKLKLIYDHFPNRIWCISSETLGLHVWQQYGRLQKIQSIQAETKTELANIGLGSIEVHPMLGRPFRRPFGADYRTITNNGILTTWQDQLDYFVGSRKTPSFTKIGMALLKAMMNQVKMWKCSKYKYLIEDKNVKTIESVPISDIKAEMKRIYSWLQEGCLVHQEKHIQEKQVHPIHDMHNVDFENKKGWYHRLAAFAVNGLPDHDSIGHVGFEFAKWLYWIDLFELPEKERMNQINDILQSFIITKNNGFVTRLNNGNEKKVFDQIKRLIRSAAKIDRKESLLVFEKIRNKIKNNNYKNNIRIVDLLTGKKNVTCGQLTHMCMPPEKLDPHYPLPEAIEEKIKEKQGMKKVFPFANVLLNKIASCGGKARVGRKWFTANGFKDPNKTKERIDVLISAGVLHRGTNYSVGRFGIEYSIPPTILEYFRV